MNKRDRMLKRIEKHGQDLLALFPDAKEQNPDKLCRKLRRLEHKATEITTSYCNGTYNAGEDLELLDIALDDILGKVRKLLGLTEEKAAEHQLFINRDPRGYALKIGLAGSRLHRDWGGYGILAPDLTND
jgi:hypothetical protein